MADFYVFEEKKTEIILVYTYRRKTYVLLVFVTLPSDNRDFKIAVSLGMAHYLKKRRKIGSLLTTQSSLG